jgi:threonine/homoserine/homoserine lactone efflux protein
MSETYSLFVAMAVFTIASPGPGVLMTLENAVSSGWKVSMVGVIGLALGAAIMAGLSSSGVGLLIRSSPMLFLLLKYCGVSYLFYLAYKSWYRAPNQLLLEPRSGGILVEPKAKVGAATAVNQYWGILAKGALLQTSNPKSLLFFLSVLPQVVDGQASSISSMKQLLVAIATYCIALILIHSVYAGLAAPARVWLSQPNASRLLSRLSALAFLTFGVTMLTLKL